MLRPVPVDLEELASVLESDPVRGGGRIDLRNGEVWPDSVFDDVTDDDEEEDDEQDAVAEEDDDDALDGTYGAKSGKPSKSSSRSRRSAGNSR